RHGLQSRPALGVMFLDCVDEPHRGFPTVDDGDATEHRTLTLLETTQRPAAQGAAALSLSWVGRVDSNDGIHHVPPDNFVGIHQKRDEGSSVEHRGAPERSGRDGEASPPAGATTAPVVPRDRSTRPLTNRTSRLPW